MNRCSIHERMIRLLKHYKFSKSSVATYRASRTEGPLHCDYVIPDILVLNILLHQLPCSRTHPTFILPTGSEWMPKKDGGRLIVTTWLLASLVFMSSYGGILKAMLTVPLVAIPIDSLEDLVSQSDLPWRLEANTVMLQYFQVKSEHLMNFHINVSQTACGSR